MNQKSLLFRVTLALVCIQSSVLILAGVVGIVPDRRAAIMEGRARLCESIAINSTYLVSMNHPDHMRTLLERIVERNPDILSLGVRRVDGSMLIDVGHHKEHWHEVDREKSTDTHIHVPIYGQDGKWGDVEVLYQPIGASGWWSYLFNTQSILLSFSSTAGGTLTAFFLSRLFRTLLGGGKAAPQNVRSALDTLAEGLLVMDRDQKIVLANHAFSNLSGIPAESLQGKSATTLQWKGENGESPYELPWVTALKLETPQPNVLLKLVDGQGNERTFNVNASPVLGKEGKYLGVLASFDDITLLQQKQVELAEARRVAESANRAKSDFLANMSHEIRTPMNAILGFTEVLLRGYARTEAQQRQYLGTIHTSGRHLLELINDILDLSKVEAGRLEVERTDCYPHRIILDTLTVLAVKAEEKGITLSYATDGPVPEIVQSDPTRMRQIITNLVGNAIKFTGKGGVQIRARHDVQGDRSELIIEIQDTGIGMGPEALGRIFNPFVQADSSTTRTFGGTGLGLVISKRFAEAMGGTITVASEAGQGSTFTVRVSAPAKSGTRFLDAATARSEQQASANSVAVAQENPQLPPAKILLVDDGEANRQLIQLVLDRAGVEVVPATNGQEALDEFAKNGPFDLILMDMQMPVMDGYTATGHLRKQGVKIPIIALTGNAMLGDEEKCRNAGCSGFLTKPVNIMQLLEKLASELKHLAGRPRPIKPASQATPSTPSGQSLEGLLANAGTTTAAQPASAVAKPARQPDGKPAPIRSSLPLNDAAFRSIVSGFVVKLRQQIEEIHKCWEARQWDRLANLAHWLKGSGGTVGFACFTEPAKRLEQLARGKQESGVPELISELKDLSAAIVVDESPAPSTVANKPAVSGMPVSVG